jgi:MFS family permease
VQWVATGYLVALAVSVPAAAWLGSRYGYGRVWAVSLAGFVVPSVLCALAPGPLTLIDARFLQGLAGRLMVPAGQAMIGSTAGPRQLGRLMGTLGLVVVLGPAVGPALGGLLLELTSWRWLFWINVPIGVAALLAARGLVLTGSRAAGRVLDRRGLAPLGIGLPLLAPAGPRHRLVRVAGAFADATAPRRIAAWPPAAAMIAPCRGAGAASSGSDRRR